MIICCSISASVVMDAVGEIIAKRSEDNESRNGSRRGSFNGSRRGSVFLTPGIQDILDQREESNSRPTSANSRPLSARRGSA